MESEIWRPVVGYEGYYAVSDFGNVKALARAVLQKSRSGNLYERVMPEKLHKPRLDSEDRYLYVNLSKNGVAQNYAVHILVLEAFVGPRPEGMHGCHNNGNTTHNHLSNLRWDTPKANNADKIAHGTLNYGEKNGNTALTNAEVAAIKVFKTEYGIGPRLGSVFGVTNGVINSILCGSRWRRVNVEDYKDTEAFKNALKRILHAGVKTPEFKAATAFFRTASVSHS